MSLNASRLHPRSRIQPFGSSQERRSVLEAIQKRESTSDIVHRNWHLKGLRFYLLYVLYICSRIQRMPRLNR